MSHQQIAEVSTSEEDKSATSRAHDSTPGRARAARQNTLTIYDQDDKLQAVRAKDTAVDAIRIMDHRPPAFGSLRDIVIINDIERRTAEETAPNDT